MKKVTLLLAIIFLSLGIYAQTWTKVDPSAVRSEGEKRIQPNKFILAKIDDAVIKEKLWRAPQELDNSRSQTATIQVMLADESIDEFAIVEYKMMEDGLSVKFPEFKTFIGQSKTNAYRSIRIDHTINGFRAVISDENGKTYIDPYQTGDRSSRIIYKKKNLDRDSEWICHSENAVYDKSESSNRDPIGSCDLKIFRLACAATGEYTVLNGGTVALAQAEIVTAFNRVNEIYEQDIHSRLVLIANNDLLVYTDGTNDPYTNNNAFTMLAENQTNVTAVIGTANFDIGHVFASSSGGVASSPSLCSANFKARGVTGGANPTGDPFWIDFVAHEVGHQFGGPHTFNGTQGNCSGQNRNDATAYEPGSGTTIMAYAGICGANDNVQNNSDAYFLGKSIERMVFIAENSGCGTTITTNNEHPVIDPLAGFTVPKSTPLLLEAVATDPDGDNLTYCWEQVDNEVGFAIPPASGNTGGAMFRSLFHNPSPKRYLPNIGAIVSNTTPEWEVLPSVARSMEFQLTVRDHALTPGCTATRSITIQVDGTAGPFLVTNSSIPATVQEGQTVNLTWDVAGTDVAPVNCANVDIFMSTDGGLTYGLSPILAGVTNDGAADVVIPLGLTTTARLMVRCSDNIFFDINDSNFEVQQGVDGFVMSLDPNSISECNDQSVSFTINTSAIGAFNTDIDLSITGLPGGTSVNYSENPVSPGNSSTVTLVGFGNNVGNFTLDVEGEAGTFIRNQDFELTLFAPTSTPSLLAPVNNAVNVSTSPTLSWSPASLASSYDYELSSTQGGGGDVISGSTINTEVDISGLSSTTNYFWRIRAINDCGASSWSQERTFTTTECTTIFSDNLPFNTVDGFFDLTSMEVSLTGTITDLDVVDLTGTHTYVSDLIVDLSSPNGNGALISLFDGICGTDDNFDLNFDDDAPAGAIQCPPTDGANYQPVGSLSDFNGQDPSGTWTLRIGDRGPGDVGVLESWGLRICTDDIGCSLSVTSNASGGPNTLRNAVDCASSGDVITLTSNIPGASIDLESAQLIIDKSLTIQASPLDNITLTYSGLQSAVEIVNNANVILNGFTIEQVDLPRIAVDKGAKLTKISMNLKKIK